ncbi:hypothetical protein FS837_002175 [Tulasnella sp. UAMH 9824]|nr:hypothetical protein FS837_002175 [Tulasnella sp. UAMH 9824]
MPAPWSIIRVLSCRQVDAPNLHPSDLDQWLEAESNDRYQKLSSRKAETIWPAPATPLKLNPLITHTSPFSSCGPIRWNTLNTPDTAEITAPTLRTSRAILFDQAATSPPVQRIRLLISIPRLIMTIGLPIVNPAGVTTSAVLSRLHDWLSEPVDETQWSKFTPRGQQAVMKQQKLNRRMVGTRLPLNVVVNLDCMDGRHFFRGLDAKPRTAVSEQALAEWDREDWTNEGWPAYYTKVYFVLLEQTPYG